MLSNKEKYKMICESGEYYVPLFLQHWWMETVCSGKQWDVALAFDGDRLMGAMPYHYGKKFGMTYIVEPQLTQFSGPVFFYPKNLTESHRLDFENRTVAQLINQIDSTGPKFFLQNFSSSVTNWLPFYWAGYKQTTRYTYRIADITDPQRVFDAFDPEKRQRKIRRYEQTTSVRYNMSASEFAAFHHSYWNAKGRKDVLEKSFIDRVCSTAVERGNGVIASLYDQEDRLLAARFVVFDSHCAYSLMSAQNMELHKNGHSELLFWMLLKYLSDKTLSFDFEGSMDAGIEYFYRSFGAKQTQFFEISKCSNSLIGLIAKFHK